MIPRVPKIPLPSINLDAPLRFFAALPEQQKRLGSYVFGAILFHLFFLFVIQIQYPAALYKPTVKARVLMLVPEKVGRETIERFNFWWGIHDPSLLLMPQKSLTTSVINETGPDIRFSKVENGSDFVAIALGQQVEFISGELPALHQRAEETLLPSPKKFEYPLPVAISSRPQSQLCIWDGFKSRLPEKLPVFPKRNAELLTEAGATVLSIGVTPDGMVRHVFIEESSGSAKADQDAITAFRGLMFLPVAGEGVAWGRVAVLWSVQPTDGKL